jgi:serine/threonine protein kinase
MVEIFQNENIKITMERKPQFKIEFTTSAYPIIRSLIKSRLISGAYSDKEYKILKFTANSVKTLSQYLHDQKTFNNCNTSIQFTAKLIQTLSFQLKSLISDTNHIILGFHPSNVIIINNLTPLYIGTEFIVELGSINRPSIEATISYPFSQNDFFISPELFKINILPSSVHYKTSYFSLACLAIYVLLNGSTDFYEEYLNNNCNIHSIIKSLDIHPIKETKLFWLLSRCLVEHPENRSILFI